MLNEQARRTVFETAQTVPYLKLLGIELVELGADNAVMSLVMKDDLRQPYGLLHGGATASLIDTAMAFAVISVLPAGERATTVDLTVQYLRPHTSGKIVCTAKVTRAGKRLLFLSAEVVNEQGKLVATGLSTYTKVGEV